MDMRGPRSEAVRDGKYAAYSLMLPCPELLAQGELQLTAACIARAIHRNDADSMRA